MLLGPLEKPLLQWFCARMPLWVNSDILTILGVLGSVLVFSSYWLTNIDKNFLWLASLGIFIHWFGDSLDGTLARYRKVERPRYGFFIDHTLDSFSSVLFFIGIGLSPYVRLEVAALACIVYLLLLVLIYINTVVGGEFKISYAKIGPTEIRIIVILVNTIIFFLGNPEINLGFGSMSVFNLFITIIAIVFFTTFVMLALTGAMKWAKLDS
jgi:phosphatidylglycerophosphate synthase